MPDDLILLFFIMVTLPYTLGLPLAVLWVLSAWTVQKFKDLWDGLKVS
jgi:hypothetical protein